MHASTAAITAAAPAEEKPFQSLKVLVACEFSGEVREAFLEAGHDAWSCDLRPAEGRTNRHIQGDVRDVLRQENWDCLIVCHPPCTRLCNSGVRWLSTPPPGKTLEQMWAELDAGCELFSDMWNADVPHVVVENPVMHKHAKARIRNFEKHAQSVQPWQFGTDENSRDNEKKRTCFWMRGLKPLEHTGTLDGSTAKDRVHKMPPGPERDRERSRFFPGIARAMATQLPAQIAASGYVPLPAPTL